MTTLAPFQPPPAAEHTAPGELRIALVGNPNSGKSTLFNRLTGIRQRTGNYPGVTVERKSGRTDLGSGKSAIVLDLPGTYSLAASSRDERVVVDALTGHAGPATERADLIVCVADATNLLRHMYLASQVAETGLPVVLAVNMIDAAAKQGIAIDTKLLSARLGVPVVAISASRGWGMDELRQAMRQTPGSAPAPAPGASQFNNVQWPQPVHEAIAGLRRVMCPEAAPRLTFAEMQRPLFDHDSSVAERLPWLTGVDPATAIAEAQQKLRDGGLDPYSTEPMLRYAHLSTMLEGVITRGETRRARGAESVDRILTHRVWGLIVFAGLMFGVFWAIYAGAAPLMDLIDGGFGALGETVSKMLPDSPMLRSLIVDGLIAGVGGVIVFLPQILILFFFISLLEDTGYMARAAFLMDKLFAWCGLNGKSFVPLLSSFACAVPGVMGARTIENPWARLTTILIAPLMSCSARLPVYVLLIGAVVEPRYGATVAAATLFAFHVIGLAVALPMALLFNRVFFKVKRSPFVMEMPPYRVPLLRDAWYRMWSRGMDFIATAGSIILAMAIAIWALSYFPRTPGVEEAARTAFVQTVSDELDITLAAAQERVESGELDDDLEAFVNRAFLEQSYLGRMGKTIQPIFAPAGFDWRITVGVIASFPAREVFVATLGITYNLGDAADEDNARLTTALRTAKHPDGSPVFTVPVALAVAVFFALCLQCMATVSVIVREAGWPWAVLSFTYMTALAWIGAVVTYQAGTWLAGAVA